MKTLATLTLALLLGACASSDPAPVTAPAPTPMKTPSDAPTNQSIKRDPNGGNDLTALRKTASDAIANKDTEGARASAEDAIEKNLPPDKRNDLLDKATEAARKKAKEMGKEDQLDKARSALDDFLKKKE